MTIDARGLQGDGSDAAASASGLLLDRLFVDEWERCAFVEQWIVGPPDDALPWELTEQCRGLGPVLVRRAEEYIVSEVPRIVGEVLFLAESELDWKRDASFAWVKRTAARDICPIVVSYLLDEHELDFAMAELVATPSSPVLLQRGSRFSYEGIGYPLPSRAIVCPVKGTFKVGEISEDEEGELWYEVHDRATDECMYLTGTLLIGATRLRR